MKKKDRLSLIEELLFVEIKSVSDVVAIVSAKAGVQPETIEKDIAILQEAKAKAEAAEKARIEAEEKAVKEAEEAANAEAAKALQEEEAAKLKATEEAEAAAKLKADQEAAALEAANKIAEEAKAKAEEEAADSNVIKIQLSDKELKNQELAKGRKTEYTVDEKEVNNIHVEVEKTNMTATGDKKSTPRILKFNGRSWEQFRKNGRLLGFNHIRVLFAPEGTNLEIVELVKAKKV